MKVKSQCKLEHLVSANNNMEYIRWGSKLDVSECIKLSEKL